MSLPDAGCQLEFLPRPALTEREAASLGSRPASIKRPRAIGAKVARDSVCGRRQSPECFARPRHAGAADVEASRGRTPTKFSDQEEEIVAHVARGKRCHGILYDLPSADSTVGDAEVSLSFQVLDAVIPKSSHMANLGAL